MDGHRTKKSSMNEGEHIVPQWCKNWGTGYNCSLGGVGVFFGGGGSIQTNLIRECID